MQVGNSEAKYATVESKSDSAIWNMRWAGVDTRGIKSLAHRLPNWVCRVAF